jgi:hypothetical protein
MMRLMARGDLFDFGDPTDPQKRGLDGQFIGGPKPGGLFDVPKDEGGLLGTPKPKELVGVERIGSRVDAPKKPALKGVEAWGKPMGHKQAEARRAAAAKRADVASGPQGRFALVLAVVFLAVAAWFMVQKVGSGGDDGPAGPPAPTTTRVLPGSEGRFIMPGNSG